MTNAKTQYIVSALLVILVLVAGYFGIKLPAPVLPEPLPGVTIEGGPEPGGVGLESAIGQSIKFDRNVRLAQNLEVAGTSAFTGAATFTAAPVWNAATMTFEGATADAYETTLAVTDPTADRTVTLPNVSGTVMLTQNPGIMVLGVNTVTTTLTLTHGLTTPQTAFCTLIQDSEANGATCSTTIVDSTVTLKLWKADGATAGSVGKQIAWMVTGQP